MIALERFFILYYSSELVLKLCLHRQFFFWNQDWAWNSFDFFIVTFGSYSTWLESQHESPPINITVLRVTRILRVSRILRILKAFRFLTELRLMAACVLGSILSLFWACVFMAVLVMISALVMVEAVASYRIDDPTCDGEQDPCEKLEEWFGKVRTAMFTLLQCTPEAWGGAIWSVQSV